jgi:DNA-binding protein YbaB
MGELRKQSQTCQVRGKTGLEALAGELVSGPAGAGSGTATVNGKGELIGLAVEQDLVNPAEVAMLQDLIMAAVNDGLTKARELGKQEMGKLTGGLNLPGMF